MNKKRLPHSQDRIVGPLEMKIGNDRQQLRAEERRIGYIEESCLTFCHITGPLYRPVILIDGMKNLLDEHFAGVCQTRASVPGVKEPHPDFCFNVMHRATHPGLDRVQARGRSRLASFLRHGNDAFQLEDGYVVRHRWPRQQKKGGGILAVSTHPMAEVVAPVLLPFASRFKPRFSVAPAPHSAPIASQTNDAKIRRVGFGRGSYPQNGSQHTRACCRGSHATCGRPPWQARGRCYGVNDDRRDSRHQRTGEPSSRGVNRRKRRKS